MSASAVAAIGERLREARLRKGMSVRGLARAVDVSASLISQIETGKSSPSVSTLYAITTALGYPRGDRTTVTNTVGGAVAAAEAGDNNPIINLINQAETLRDTDGQFVNGCSDALDRPTPDRVRELVVAWGKEHPQFGSVTALDLVKCLHWPSGQAPAAPKDLDAPVLLLGVQNDPIAGNEGVSGVTATILNAGTNSRRVMWQGIGHGAVIYSACALTPVIEYLTTGRLPDTDTCCPA